MDNEHDEPTEQDGSIAGERDDAYAERTWPADLEYPDWMRRDAVASVDEFENESGVRRRLITLNEYGQKRIVTLGPLNPELPTETQHQEAELRCYPLAMSRVRGLISCACGSWRYVPNFPPKRLQAEIRRFWPQFFTASGYDSNKFFYGPCLALAGRLDLPREMAQLIEAAVHVNFVSIEEARDLRSGLLTDLGIEEDLRVPGLPPGPPIIETEVRLPPQGV